MKRFTLAAVEPPRGSMVVCRWQRGNYFSSSRRANERRFNLPIIFQYRCRFYITLRTNVGKDDCIEQKIYFRPWFDSSAIIAIIGSCSVARWYTIMKMSRDWTRLSSERGTSRTLSLKEFYIFIYPESRLMSSDQRSGNVYCKRSSERVINLATMTHREIFTCRISRQRFRYVNAADVCSS